jgi:hypothetical protein
VVNGTKNGKKKKGIQKELTELRKEKVIIE